MPGAILKSVEDWKFSSGALVLCLVAYSDGRDVHSFQSVKFFGQCIVSDSISSVESTPIAGNSFTKSCNEWRDGTYDNFKDWATRQFGVKPLVSDDEADIPVDFQKAKHIVFEKNKKGYFKLPPKTDFKKNKQRQRVIRGYIGAVYRTIILSFPFVSIF